MVAFLPINAVGSFLQETIMPKIVTSVFIADLLFQLKIPRNLLFPFFLVIFQLLGSQLSSASSLSEMEIGLTAVETEKGEIEDFDRNNLPLLSVFVMSLLSIAVFHPNL